MGYYGVCHVIDDVTRPQRCREAVRSAILATAWLLVSLHYSVSATLCNLLCLYLCCRSCELCVVLKHFRYVSL